MVPKQKLCLPRTFSAQSTPIEAYPFIWYSMGGSVWYRKLKNSIDWVSKIQVERVQLVPRGLLPSTPLPGCSIQTVLNPHYASAPLPKDFEHSGMLWRACNLTLLNLSPAVD